MNIAEEMREAYPEIAEEMRRFSAKYALADGGMWHALEVVDCSARGKRPGDVYIFRRARTLCGISTFLGRWRFEDWCGAPFCRRCSSGLARRHDAA